MLEVVTLALAGLAAAASTYAAWKAKPARPSNKAPAPRPHRPTEKLVPGASPTFIPDREPQPREQVDVSAEQLVKFLADLGHPGAYDIGRLGGPWIVSFRRP